MIDQEGETMPLLAAQPADEETTNEQAPAARLPKDSGFQNNSLRAWWPEACTLAAFGALLAYAIPFHEPWADEAQAWQMARSLSLPDLFKTYLRYEGSPGLWQLLLWILNRAHIGYTAMHWVCGLIAVAATAVLLFCSPFPRSLKLPLPFTYFLAFQYALVARNYVLAPLLLFLVAVFWKRSPVLLTVLLGLLANTSLHLAVISGGLAIVFAVEQWREGRFLLRNRQRTFLACSLLLMAFYAFAVWTAKPPHDVAFHTRSGSGALPALLRMLEILQPAGLALVFWIGIALCFAARRALIYLLPVGLCAGFCVAVYASWWHVGLLFPLVVTLLWITWPNRTSAPSRRETFGRVALLAYAALQILWSAYAFRFDHAQAYSPDRAAAAWLEPYVDQRATIAVTYADEKSTNAFDAVGLLPYFDHNIFLNLHHAFWWWSAQDTTEADFNRLLPSHPRLVIVEAVFKGSVDRVPLNEPKYIALNRSGYSFASEFCGSIPEALAPALTNCHVIFEYASPIPYSSAAQTRAANENEPRTAEQLPSVESRCDKTGAISGCKAKVLR